MTLIAVIMTSVAGCSSSSDSAIEQEITSISPGPPSTGTAEPRAGEAQYLPEGEPLAVRSLRKRPQEDVLRVAVKLFTQAQDPETRARALGVLSLIGQREGSAPLQNQKMAMLHQGLADQAAVVRAAAIEGLAEIAPGSEADRDILRKTVMKETDEDTLFVGYRTLVLWNDWDTLADAICSDRPSKEEEAAPSMWLRRASAALQVCARAKAAVPNRIEARVPRLIEAEPQLLNSCLGFLWARGAKPMLPEVLNVYGRLPVGRAKALLGATILSLDREAAPVREEMPQLQESLVRRYPTSQDKKAALEDIREFHWWLTRRPESKADRMRLEAQLWKGYSELPPDAKGQCLFWSLWSLGTAGTEPGEFLSQVPDAELLRMIKGCDSLRDYLILLFRPKSDAERIVLGRPSEPTKQDERIIALLDRATAGGSP
jgi:hypothetical protein